MKVLFHCVDPNSHGDNGIVLTSYDIGSPQSHDTPGLFPSILVRFWITMVYSK
jgi:hypothetical protein